MHNALFSFPIPPHERVLDFARGSMERRALEEELARQYDTVVEIPVIIDGREIYTGDIVEVRMPTEHGHVLAYCHMAREVEIAAACDQAVRAHTQWSHTPWVERAAIQLRAAEFIAGPWRWRLLAATMLGQGKNVHQAEIDAIAEVVDFLRFNAAFASHIFSWQPVAAAGQWNVMEYRPLEGFVLAISPFNFTSIASNLANAPILMGNTVVWKPATTALLSNYYLMRVFQEAGMPPGVLQFVPAPGSRISKVALSHPAFTGLHFTGSNATFNTLWKQIAKNLEHYRSYPRLVGETGGKDFVFVHESAAIEETATALVRGAFEYQGQKCSAASRAYVPASLWPQLSDALIKRLSQITLGDVRDFSHFMNAVIDKTAFLKLTDLQARAHADAGVRVVFGGKAYGETGWFVEPTVIEVNDPRSFWMQEEFFGPILSIYVYPDNQFEETLQLCNETSPYGLTGAVFAQNRDAVTRAIQALRYAAGNLYINDKPTGAVVGLQPFGGARASGTNDKSGSPLNLLRWTSPRNIKETFVPPVEFRYPSNL